MTPAALAAASAKRARGECRVKRVGVGPHAHQKMLKEPWPISKLRPIAPSRRAEARRGGVAGVGPRDNQEMLKNRS